MRVFVGAAVVGLSLSGCILLADWGDKPVTYSDNPCDPTGENGFPCLIEGWVCIDKICYPPDAGIFQEAGVDGEADADGSL
jgi:hypothetical protein